MVVRDLYFQQNFHFFFLLLKATLQRQLMVAALHTPLQLMVVELHTPLQRPLMVVVLHTPLQQPLMVVVLHTPLQQPLMVVVDMVPQQPQHTVALRQHMALVNII